MKVEAQFEDNKIKINGFSIILMPEKLEDQAYIRYEVRWKESFVDSFESLKEAISYCQN